MKISKEKENSKWILVLVCKYLLLEEMREGYCIREQIDKSYEQNAGLFV